MASIFLDSNTTLVKVKFPFVNLPFEHVANSNTTLVKVKFFAVSAYVQCANGFKYNTC